MTGLTAETSLTRAEVDELLAQAGGGRMTREAVEYLASRTSDAGSLEMLRRLWRMLPTQAQLWAVR